MPLQDIPLPFGEWLPDLGENNNPGLVEAKNVIGMPGGYAPIINPQEFAGSRVATSADVVAAFGYNNNLAATSAFVDCATHTVLYTQLGGASLTVGAGAEIWSFAEFNRSIYALRGGDSAASTRNLYSHALGTAISTPAYAAVAVDGLRGRSLARIGNFLMIGAANDIIGTSTVNPFFIRWSAFNDATSWAPSQTTQAGVAEVTYPNLGDITDVIGGRFGVVFQQGAISRLTYVGPPKVWQVDVISTNRGMPYKGSAVQVDDVVYFIAHDGIFVTNGASVQPLGVGRVDNWIVDLIAAKTNPVIQSSFVPRENSIIWGVGEITGAANQFSDFLVYSIRTNRFSRVSLPEGVTASAVSPGAIQTNLGFGTLTASAYLCFADGTDQRAYPIRTIFPGATQDTLAAELTTGYTTLTPGKLTITDTVEPIYDGSGAKVAVNTKATLSGAAAAGTPAAANSLGIAPARASGRLAAVSVTFDAAASWSELKGAIVTADTSGAR